MTRFLFLFLLTAFASAQEQMIRQQSDAKTDTHVEVTALFSRPAADGYFPVRVKIANNLNKDAAIRLRFNSSSGYGSDLKCVSSFDFSAPPEKTVTRDILVPQHPVGSSHGNSVNLFVEMTGSMGTANHSISASYEKTQPSVLLSEPLYTPNASKLDAEMTSKLTTGSYGTAAGFASKFTAGQLPDNWLAYSGFDHVLMLDSEWTSAPAGARTAILSWVRLGGRLMIYSPTSATAASLSLPEQTGFGKIEIRSIRSDFTLNAAETVLRVMANPPPRKQSLENDYSSAWPLRAEFGDEAFRYAIFIIILILFGILVGPINLFVFAKSGRRHRLFITTPLISLGASLLLIVLIIFQDGFGGRGQRTVLMEIDGNAAYLHQEQFSRTGVLTRSSFTVDPAVLFTPVQVKQTSWARYTHRATEGSFSLQPSAGKLEAAGDWFQSRSEQGHSITGVLPTRGRIEATSSPDRLVSTFDFPIDTLYYLDPSGKWHRASGVTTGQPFQLTSVDESMVMPEIELSGARLAGRNQDFFRRVNNRRGHFIALTGSGPAIATHPGIRWEKTTTVITGQVATP